MMDGLLHLTLFVILPCVFGLCVKVYDTTRRPQ